MRPKHRVAPSRPAGAFSCLKEAPSMSGETLQHLNTQTLIGNTEHRGTAWHYRADLQAGEPNHYPGPIPIGDVRRRLFGWQADSRALAAPALAADLRLGNDAGNHR